MQSRNISILDMNQTMESEGLTNFTTLGIEMPLMILIICGNILTIYAVYSTPSLQTPTNNFVISLAMADLIVGVMMPLHSAFLVTPSLPYNKWACLVRITCLLTPCCASIFSLLLIAVDRHIAILDPLHYQTRMSSRKSKILILIVWIYVVFLGVLVLFWNSWIPSEMPCIIANTLTTYYIYVFISAQYFIVIFIIIVLYTQIFCAAKVQERRMSGRTNSNPQHIAENDNHSQNNTYANSRKATTTLMLVVGLFLLCWTPFVTVLTLQVLDIDISYQVYLVILFLAITNSSLNPVVYGWRNSQFRQAYRKVFHKMCAKCSWHKEVENATYGTV